MNPFLEGIREAGATVDVVYAKKLNIKPCIGDFQCWFKKVGQCIHSDDMQSVLSKIREANILVLATPVYLPLPGEFQNLLNRLMPVIEPVLEFREGRTRARFHNDVKVSKIVLVASGGWWERGNLGTVIRIAEEIAADVSVEFSGSVLRPHAFLLRENEEKAKEVTEAARKVGYQLVNDGKMSQELLDLISQPLISEEELRERYNKGYENASGG